MRAEQKKEILKYIDDMQKQGHSVDSIRSHLVKHGYPKKAIDEAFANDKKVDKTAINPGDKLSHGEKIFILCFGLALLVFMIWLGLMTKASVLVVFVSFMPTLLTIVSAYIMFDDSKKRFRYLIWLIPIITVMIFTYIAKSGTLPPLANTESGNIATLNMLASAFFLFLISVVPGTRQADVQPDKTRESDDEKQEYYVSSFSKPHVEGAKKAVKKNAPALGSEEQLCNYIGLIEEKAKALNFVIGRVYSTKHGASKEVRDSIRISSAGYDELSKWHKEGCLISNLDAVKRIVHTFYNHLRDLQKSEAAMFGKDCHKIKLLTRDPSGNSRIIDVLVVNDKDPVQTYFQSAVDLCMKALSEIKAIEQVKGGV